VWLLTIVQTAWEGELGRESVFGCQHSGFELARMPLHLIAMLVDTAKEVCASMDVEHYAIAFGDCQLFPRVIVLAHLDPFSLECCSVTSPLSNCQLQSCARAGIPHLPPVLPSDCFDAFWA
jgi:hypothetical protein